MARFQFWNWVCRQKSYLLMLWDSMLKVKGKGYIIHHVWLSSVRRDSKTIPIPTFSQHQFFSRQNPLQSDTHSVNALASLETTQVSESSESVSQPQFGQSHNAAMLVSQSVSLSAKLAKSVSHTSQSVSPAWKSLKSWESWKSWESLKSCESLNSWEF